MTKHRHQSTKVKVKEPDLIWSQICSSLLHMEVEILRVERKLRNCAAQ